MRQMRCQCCPLSSSTALPGCTLFWKHVPRTVRSSFAHVTWKGATDPTMPWQGLECHPTDINLFPTQG